MSLSSVPSVCSLPKPFDSSCKHDSTSLSTSVSSAMDEQDVLVVEVDFLLILPGRRRLLHMRDDEPSVIDSSAKLTFFLRSGLVSKQSGELSRLQARAVEGVVARCTGRFAAPEDRHPALLYELGVPLRPLILRDLVLAPRPPAEEPPTLLFLLSGGIGLHWTAANNARNTFMSSFPLI